MNAVSVLFYFFVLTAGIGALAILFSSNVFKSALYLLATLVSLAALYALTYAEFLAVAQILVYAGGITVVIIFGIMLTTRIAGRPLIVKNAHMFSGGLAALTLFILFVSYMPTLVIDRSTTPADVSFIAFNIFSSYALPFEIAGLLLLIALVGAAVIAAHLKSKA